MARFPDLPQTPRRPPVSYVSPPTPKIADACLFPKPVHAAAQAAHQSSAPITMHLFGCQDASMIEQAFELPSDSIMVAVPHPSKKTRFAKTKEQVVYCQAHNKVATAERSDYWESNACAMPV
ncbi:fructose-bisphosphate aldolase class-II domain-containing protein [Trichoderma breve]|uniref:Fructose-bisphosphate aldolase n=1 Tax=Trichoderma breve TaxID=2034170 RepID=A0A9W9EA43_9HYPO|nr:fructose-bisphosphate aldolase class-II domain-containing protein [Trichoderma breve]KAJ4861621.1 fructose-bisphosphate aldolase class-II domain-containing protein [Trichoderma breve]